MSKMNPEVKAKWLAAFVLDSNKDVVGAKFKIGDVVTFTHTNLAEPMVTKVIAVSPNDDTFEYAVEGATFLAWESELS